MLNVFCLFLLCGLAWARTGEVCFPFGSFESSGDVSQPTQGRPGRIGPRGPPGLTGNTGEPGSPGNCSCNPNEVQQLREEIELRDALYCGIGLKDGRVRDQDITASRTINRYHQPYFARLDKQGTEREYGGWLACSGSCGRGQWLQVDLRKPTRVIAVVTQGLNYLGNSQQWVTSYKISYGNSTSSMQVIQNEYDADLIFNGNTDNNSHVTNEFPTPVIARFFRLIVQTWRRYGDVRLEYLTC